MDQNRTLKLLLAKKQRMETDIVNTENEILKISWVFFFIFISVSGTVLFVYLTQVIFANFYDKGSFDYL